MGEAMRCLVEFHGKRLESSEDCEWFDAEPICGVDFDDGCGDCCACFGDECGQASGFFVIELTRACFERGGVRYLVLGVLEQGPRVTLQASNSFKLTSTTVQALLDPKNGYSRRRAT